MLVVYCPAYGTLRQELDLVGEDSAVFKLIGPALIRQDLVEAKANVSKRLEFIGGELSRLVTQLRVPQEKLQRAQEQARSSVGRTELPSVTEV